MSSHHQAKDMMGYRFHPTNKELLKYLLGFAINKPFPQQYQYMQLVNLYADKEPWELFDGTKNNTGYFITQQNKEKEQHVRVKRTVGINGTWKLQGKVNKVFDDQGKLMGYVKNLKYKPHPQHKKSSDNPNGEWLMTEYSLYDRYVDPKKIKNKGFVVCKIKKKEEKHGDNKQGVNNDEDAAEYIDSVLQDEEDISIINENNEYLEGDEVEEHIIAILG
ncbi:hypothetical protein CQW23_25426 [Capsicum baccatum]|uniref:NAC domain-containing protein n=1 Tax=Capsicum baccatum TaxID=33114 RepID=A0A2G2VKW6_CAPBA|nr:hypothetical protein CQW23_25426 [Capsicum baccatum]